MPAAAHSGGSVEEPLATLAFRPPGVPSVPARRSAGVGDVDTRPGAAAGPPGRVGEQMESSFRLGRIAGIDVGVNWSWLVVFALLVWSLAVGVFPNQDAGRGRGTYVAMAVVAAILFLA